MTNQNQTPQLTPGFKTSEFWSTLIVDVLAILTLFGVHVVISNAAAQALASTAAFLAAALTTHGYVTGRSNVKVALATAQGTVGAAVAPLHVVNIPQAVTDNLKNPTPTVTRAATATMRTDPRMPAQTTLRPSPTPAAQVPQPTGPVAKADEWVTDTAPIPMQQNNPTQPMAASGYQSIFPQGVPS